MRPTCLNQKELAARWRISHRTLEKRRWAGEGPVYIKICGRVVYRLEDILAFARAVLLERTRNQVPEFDLTG